MRFHVISVEHHIYAFEVVHDVVVALPVEHRVGSGEEVAQAYLVTGDAGETALNVGIVAEEVVDAFLPQAARLLQRLPTSHEILFVVGTVGLVVELGLEYVCVLQVHAAVVDGLEYGECLAFCLCHGFAGQFYWQQCDAL